MKEIDEIKNSMPVLTASTIQSTIFMNNSIFLGPFDRDHFVTAICSNFEITPPNCIYKNNKYSQDVFYKFIFGKVYTVSSFQGSHYETSGIENFLGLSRKDAFLGIKEIRPSVEDDCASKANFLRLF